uniref:Zn-ribbon domain-containing OB-fold protein n=1 Tax=Cupriavidus yeoncheonensis TaxID=1462994 RepID=UPI003F49105D
MPTDETTSRIEKPSLSGWDVHERPFFKGVRCPACQEVAFPPQHYGCECCGNSELADIELAAQGVVLGSSQVHIHAQPERAVPFTVAEVRLDAGPVVRALLDVEHEAGDWYGRRVHGVLRQREQEPAVLEFRFGVTA